MKETIDYKKIAGKTIEKIVSRVKSVAIHFTDGTASVILISTLYGESRLVDYVNFSLYDSKDLELMTQEEFDTETAEQQRVLKERSEEFELREFERLKAKFDSKG